jgi:hypothetical protein
MKRLFFLFIACFAFNFGFSQTEVRKKPDPNTDPGLAEFIKRHDDNQAKLKAQDASQGLYYGFEATLKSYMESNIIPASLPQATGYTNKAEYVKAVNVWLSENKQYLKTEYKNSLITE